MTIQKINSCGTSKAVVISKDFFDHWKGKGKSFSEVNVRFSEDMEKIVITPILEDLGAKKK
jgi:hypothetical protein